MREGKIIAFLCLSIAAVILAGCGKEKNAETKAAAKPLVESGSGIDIPEHKKEVPKEQQLLPETEPEPAAEIPPEIPQTKGIKIAIDAGHQAQGNSEQEPIGPGAGESKAKVASGTQGVVTGVSEYELTLAVSQQLEQELHSRGYEVLMVRTGHDVNISNAERAAAANASGASAFVRIHANGLDDQSVRGALTMCMTAGNPYNGNLYEQSQRLSQMVLNGLCNASGAVAQSIIETDIMSGINWCTIPVTIVEMGYMTNPEEDQLMQTPEYQNALARGIADGLDAYFL